MFLAEGLEPRCVILKEHKDPDEAITSIGVEGFRRLLDYAVPMVDYLLESVAQRYDLGSFRGRNLAVEECLPVLREIANSTGRDYFIERFASRIRVREERLRQIIKAGGRVDSTSRAGNTASHRRLSLFDFPTDERNVVRGMLLSDAFIERVLESGVLKDLENPVLSDLAHRMVSFRQEAGVFDALAFARSLDDENLAALVARSLSPRREENDITPEFDGDRTVDQSLDAIRLRKLEKRKEEIKQRMRQCVPGEEEYNSLARELVTIGRRLHGLA